MCLFNCFFFLFESGLCVFFHSWTHETRQEKTFHRFILKCMLLSPTVMLRFPTTVIAPSMYILACVVYAIFVSSPSKIQTEGNLVLQCVWTLSEGRKLLRSLQNVAKTDECMTALSFYSVYRRSKLKPCSVCVCARLCMSAHWLYKLTRWDPRLVGDKDLSKNVNTL